MPALGGTVVGRNGRIPRIYSHDGPGLPQAMVDGQGLPCHQRANRQDGTGIVDCGHAAATSAHAPWSRPTPSASCSISARAGRWPTVRSNGRADCRAAREVVKKTIDTWLDTVGRERRGRAIDQLYEIFAAAVCECDLIRTGQIRC